MIEFHAPAADALELAVSLMHRAAIQTLCHLSETGPIGLTRYKACKQRVRLDAEGAWLNPSPSKNHQLASWRRPSTRAQANPGLAF